MLSRKDFIDVVAANMEVDAAELAAMTFADLGLDSIRLYELDLLVESLGVLLPEQALVSMQGIDDVYSAYAREASLQSLPDRS